MLGEHSGNGPSILSVIKARRQAQDVYSSDPKFKKFGQQVERCLSSFENVQEWADCIAFLKNLLKTLQAYAQYKDIPRKPIVSKRLSQCLNPALPTGVHQRALEVYSHIFSVLGSEGIKRDLALWTSGIFPFFEYAATAIKPSLLNLYDTHLLPLQDALRPSIKAFILCLLPGLEEETGEFFEQVLGLLDKLSGTVSPAYFFQNMWLILLTTPSARGTALTFLSKRLPRLNADEDITSVVGNDTGLLIRAFAAALEDENLLVQRSALDLLLQSLSLDSKTLREANAEDLEIIMRAAYSVVLRRDLSLNRRLYTWLLGSAEATQAQEEFFSKYSLTLLASTLRTEMRAPSNEYAFSRPFKVFVSLLDKWEIGGPLSDALVIDAMKALRSELESDSDDSQDVSTTASTLYESVEPSIFWKHILQMIVTDLVQTPSYFEGVRLANFSLKTFHHDEEIQALHLPVVLSAVLDLLKLCLHSDSCTYSSSQVQDIIVLCQSLIANCSDLSTIPWPKLEEQSEDVICHGSLEFARCYYRFALPETLRPISRTRRTPISDILEDLFHLSSAVLEGHEKAQQQSTLEIASGSLEMICSLLQKPELAMRRAPSLEVAWQPTDWISRLLDLVKHAGSSFALCKLVTNTALTLHRHKTLFPQLRLETRSHITFLINTFLDYLVEDAAAYHHRAVQLIWSLDAISTQPLVESLISSRLASPKSSQSLTAYGIFGTLWRLTDEELIPGTRLYIPALTVVGSLNSKDMSIRQAAETWMRVSLYSVIRIVDPVLNEILRHDTLRVPCVTHINGKDLPGFQYGGAMDQRRLIYLLDTLLAIIRHGGLSFIRSLRTIHIRDSFSPNLAQHDQSGASYLDILLNLLLRCLQTEPKPDQEALTDHFNQIIQSTAADLIQVIVSRGGVDDTLLSTMESAVISRLYLAIHKRRLHMQDRLLHLLHSILSATSSLESMTDTNGDQSQHRRQVAPSFFTRVLVDGVTTPSNRPIFQHWFDFIVTTLPKPQFNLAPSTLPLIDCIARELQLALDRTMKAYQNGTSLVDVPNAVSDVDFAMYLNALESLVLASRADTNQSRASDAELYQAERVASESGGLFGLFGSDSTAPAAEVSTSANVAGDAGLRRAVGCLFSITSTVPQTKDMPAASAGVILEKLQARSRRVLERLWRGESMEILEHLASFWHAGAESSDGENIDAVFDLVDTLASGAQAVVHMLCERIASKSTALIDKSRKPTATPGSDGSEWMLFAFLERYLQRLEGPVAVQVWPRYMQLAKEISAVARDARPQAYATLRCTTALADHVVDANGLDERRSRKEFQDVYMRLFDSTVSIIVSREQGSWTKRKEALAVNGRDSPIPRTSSATPFNEKMDSVTDLPATGMDDKNAQVIYYILTSVCPKLRKFLVDPDRIAAACTNVVYNIVTPSLKGKSRPLDVDDHIFTLIQAISAIPGTLKVWRGIVYDALNDTRVFNSTAEAGQRWQTITNALLDADRSVLPELLAKVATAHSANIFANREYEMLLQSLSLRRLSYVIFAAEKNHFLAQLPSVIEKLVEIFKNVTSPVVHSEVYLCLRVLLCRLSPHNLTSFWPVVLTELYRTFEQLLQTMPPDGSETLPLILSASKFIDLLLVLQTQEFQVHQWIFITDTVDAIYRPDDWAPEGLLDQLAEVAADLPVSDTRSTDGNIAVNLPPTPSPLPAARQAMRRPMLNKIGQIDSVRDLVYFFSHVSMATYESVYASPGAVDWTGVERGILEDMFDGR